MKKLSLSILLSLILVVCYGQKTPIEGLSTTTSAGTNDYITVFNDVAFPKTAKKMYAPFFNPFTISGGYIRPRSATDKLMLGTSGTFEYTFYNAGTSFFNNTVYMPANIRFNIGSSYIQQDPVTLSLMFYDPLAGSKALSELLSGGSGDISYDGTNSDAIGSPAGSVAVFTSNPQGGATQSLGASSLRNNIYLYNRSGYGLSMTSTQTTINGGTQTYILGQETYIYGYNKLELHGKTNMYDTVFFHYLDMASSDTFGMVVTGANEKLKAYPLTPAAAGWDAKLSNYWSFYKDSKLHKALPLPYPDGTERRQFNAVNQGYQTEFELERIHRYFFRMWLENKAQWLIIALLAFGLYKVRK
jgi:hypothetical protein